MRLYAFAAATVAGFLLTAFLVVAALDVALFDDPRPALATGGAESAVVGVALLVADAILPVPASLVMIALGTLYGPAAGAALALAGRFGMAVVGFAIGRRGGELLARAVPSWERAYADDLIDRWGAWAIVVSRPVPLLAETVMILAGASRLTRRRALLAAFVGSVPEAVAYAAVGAMAASYADGALVFVGFLVVATLFRLVERRQRMSSHTRSATTSSSTAAAGT